MIDLPMTNKSILHKIVLEKVLLLQLPYFLKYMPVLLQAPTI